MVITFITPYSGDPANQRSTWDVGWAMAMMAMAMAMAMAVMAMAMAMAVMAMAVMAMAMAVISTYPPIHLST